MRLNLVVDAQKPPGKGRPYGGLQVYCNKNLHASVVSQSNHHLAIKIGLVTLIGCYYQPTMCIDDIVCDIEAALSKAPDINRVVFGGDFNLRPEKKEFDEVVSIFSQNRISLRSDLGIPTYLYSSGRSTIDHIFMSTLLNSPSFTVHNVTVSDHLPISTTMRIKKNQSKYDITIYAMHQYAIQSGS